MSAKKFLSVLLVMTLLFSASSFLIDVDSSAESVYKGDFLLDRGNGDTVWLEIKNGTTNADVIIESLTYAGIDCAYVGSTLEIEGKSSTTIGAPGDGSFIKTGTTGVTTVSTWKVFLWDSNTKEWTLSAPTADYDGGPIAVAFYPDGILPIETPEYKSSWTMIYADANNSGNQTAELTEDKKTYWSSAGDEIASGCYTNALYARGHAFVKFGMSKAGSSNGTVVSFNAITGEKEWTFVYPIQMIEMSCIALMGQYIYVQSSNGHIYKFEWAVGPGENNENVTTFDGLPYDSDTKIPNWTEWALIAGGTIDSASLDQTYLADEIAYHNQVEITRGNSGDYDAIVAAAASIEGSIAEGGYVYERIEQTIPDISSVSYGAKIGDDHYLLKFALYYNGTILNCTDSKYYLKGNLNEYDVKATIKNVANCLKNGNDTCGQNAEAIAEYAISRIPGTGANLIGTPAYGVGPYSMVVDSGSISSNAAAVWSTPSIRICPCNGRIRCRADVMSQP